MSMLAPGTQVLAFKLQEALMQSDIRARLSDAVSDAFRGAGSWGYYIDHRGEDSTGDVVYSVNGDMRMCGYEISEVGGKVAVKLDMESSKNVVPSTSYQEEAEDADHYTAMEESFKAANLYTALPLYERFISKKERDAATDDDFAGKGRSFPILEPGDIAAAVRSIGQAGSDNVSSSTIKNRIIAIAKRKGWTQYLPKAWRGDEAKPAVESVSRGTVENGDQPEKVKLFESAATLETIVLQEARADYETKLIAPGKGSSAFYPAEVLKRDGPKVFKAGTHIYLNHPTQAEEAARPEGDVKNLAGVLTSDAVYHESHAKGPGLYARMKVFADHAQIVEEKAAHVGMSIRASGIAESGTKKDGLPVLKELTSAESVDVVTKAGAGGMILTESARGAQEEMDMDLKETQRLINEGIATATAPLLERAIRGDAREEAGRILAGVTMPDAAKQKVTESALRSIPKKDGALDVEAFRAIVVAEAKSEGEYLAQLIGSGEVRGMGAAFGAPQVDPAKLKEARDRAKAEALDLEESEASVFSELTGLQLVKGKVA